MENVEVFWGATMLVGFLCISSYVYVSSELVAICSEREREIMKNIEGKLTSWH